MGTDFYAVLDQVVALLRSRGRVTCNVLQFRFNLDDAQLAVLKAELLYAHPQVVDDAGRGLIWTRDEGLLAPHGVLHSAVLRLYEELVSALLQRPAATRSPLLPGRPSWWDGKRKAGCYAAAGSRAQPGWGRWS